MKVPKRTRRGPEIPLASMSDLAMLLLIFFIVTTQFLIQRAIQAELPSITHEKKETDEMITVVVEVETVYLDEERMKLEDLAHNLATKLADKVTPEDRAVIVDATETVRWERVATAVNEVKRAGGIPTMMKVED